MVANKLNIRSTNNRCNPHSPCTDNSQHNYILKWLLRKLTCPIRIPIETVTDRVHLFDVETARRKVRADQTVDLQAGTSI